MLKYYILRTNYMKIIIHSTSIKSAVEIFKQYYPNSSYSIRKLKLNDLAKNSDTPLLVLPEIQYL